MASSLFDRSLFNATTSSDVTTPAPSFSDFQFKTIGQAPDLLKRMFVANQDSQIHEESGRASLSPEPDLVNEPHTSESADNASNLPKQPSLRERLAIVDDDAITTTSTTINASETRPSSIFSWKPSQTNDMALATSDRSTKTLEDSAAHKAPETSLSHSSSVNDSPLALSFTSQQTLRTSPKLEDNDTLLQAPDIWKDGDSAQSTRRNFEGTPHDASHLTAPSASATTATTPDPPIFAALEALQIQLVTSLANLAPINTQDTVLLARSAKDQCTEVSSSANHAYSLARKALTAAEESMNAAKECLAVAETIQTRSDEVLVAVERIANGNREQLWNGALKSLRTGLHELDRWSREAKSQYRREHEEREKERRNQRLATQRQNDGSNIQGTPPAISSIENNLHLLPLAAGSASRSAPLTSVEHEADDARARSKIYEKNAEEKRIVEEELRKCERQQEEARSALAVAKAERIAAEDKEKVRQKEAQQAELHYQELERKREEAFRAKKASEERALEAAREKDKALQVEREEALRRAQQEEQKRKETTEKEALQRRLAAEKVQALEAQALESQRQQQRHEQELKRQEVAAQKQRAAAEAAKRILTVRAKLKQTRSENNATQPVHNVSLPTSPSPNYESPPQNKFPAQHDHSSLRNANDSSIEHSSSTTSTMEKTAFNDTDGGSLLNRIAASATSSNGPLSISCRRGVPAVDAINPLSRAISTRSEFSGRFLAENVSITAGQTRNAADITQQNRKDNKKLPPLTILPPVSALPGTRPAGLPNKPVENSDQVHGNVSPFPASQPSPIAHKVNLQPQMMDTKTILENNEVKVDNYASKISQGKRKAETLGDIPLLSLPSPPARIASFKETTLPIEKSKASETVRPRPNPKQKGKKPSTSHSSKATCPAKPLSGKVMTSTKTVATQQYDAVPNLEGLPWPNPTLMATLPPKPSGLSMQGAPKPMGQFCDYDASSRMGPDTVTADAWMQPSASQGKNQDLSLDHRQGRTQSPARSIHRGDHYSPSSGSIVNKRIPQPRTRPPRRGDHYSPRRVPSPLLAYNGHVSPDRSQSRGSSGDYSRLVTPELPYQNQASLQQGVSLKRKRVHLNDQASGPPQRRPRYEDQYPHQDNPRLGAQYAPMSVRNDSQADWSNIANYSRSPSPEPHRRPPLHLRLKESDRTYRPPTPEVFRPPPLHLRLEESDRTYRPNQGLNELNNQYTDPLQHYDRQSPIQGFSYHDERSNYQANHMPRRNARQPTNDSRPPLLDRFTDPTPPDNHPVSGRGSRPRGRGGANQPSASRTTKGHLIDRLANP
ncbi:hypothetical protein BJ912DRAFT_1055559 [Pholiota molesta]|nr:hypothetical protein BJ912DRAFT_1055559 [Pholiota molesta]